MNKTCFLIICFLGMYCANAQPLLLDKKISIVALNEKPAEILQQISKKCGFYFSYDSRFVPDDTLVSINKTNATVREILTLIFVNKLDYKESGNYIILLKRIPKAPVALNNLAAYLIKGTIKDETTNAGLANVSVYEKTKLAATLTGSDGTFILKLKTKQSFPTLYISRQYYRDTSIAVLLPQKNNILISLQGMRLPKTDTNTITIISPTSTLPVIIADSIFALTKTGALKIDTTKTVERTRTGIFLLSARQKIQSLNLQNFYTTRLYQLSLTPGISTHGRLSAQVENTISINAIGGYTGGVKVFEAGGIFNISKRNVQYAQAAGVFNIVGGKVTGVQAAGIYNKVLGNVSGVQAAGIGNIVNKNVKGAQLSGIFNVAKDSINGAQVAGIANVTARTINGVQVAGIINYAKKLNGLQIGLINLSDSSNGYSIGLINIVKYGYHQLTVSANELMNADIALKTGNHKLYSILEIGYNVSKNHKLFSYGYGFGATLKANAGLIFQPELRSQYLYTGSWRFTNILSTFRLNVQHKISKNISVFAAPVLNVYVTNQSAGIKGYQFPATSHFASIRFNTNVTGWPGFSAGIALF